MNADHAVPHQRLFRVSDVLRLRCPRCHRGKLFSSWFDMHPRCEQCSLQFQREPGFYLGSIYFNYGVASLLGIGAYFALAFAGGLPAKLALAICVVLATTFPLWFFRYARSLFLTIDYFINPISRSNSVTSITTECAAAAAMPSELVPPVCDNRESTEVGNELSRRETIADNRWTASELAAFRADDATAGLVVGIVISVVIIFGLALTVSAIATDVFGLWQSR